MRFHLDTSFSIPVVNFFLTVYHVMTHVTCLFAEKDWDLRDTTFKNGVLDSQTVD